MPLLQEEEITAIRAQLAHKEEEAATALRRYQQLVEKDNERLATICDLKAQVCVCVCVRLSVHNVYEHGAEEKARRKRDIASGT